MRKRPEAAGALALCILTAGCAGLRGTGRPEILEITEYTRCPNPPGEGLTTVEPDGKATYSWMEGFDFPPRSTTRQKKQLPKKDAKELFDLVARSGFESFPGEITQRWNDERGCFDCCDGSLEVKTASATIRVSFVADGKPGKVTDLLKGIDRILDRYEWQEDLYPWEKK